MTAKLPEGYKKREVAEISRYVRVSILERENGNFDVAVLTNYFPELYPDRWTVDESEVQAREDQSSMQVYGYIEYEVRPAYEPADEESFWQIA